MSSILRRNCRSLKNGIEKQLNSKQIAVSHRQRFLSSAGTVQDDPSLWVRSVLPDITPIKGVPLQEYLFEDISKWEGATAFSCGITGRKYTYGQLYQLSKNFGAALINSGLKRGNVLAAVLPNMPEFPIAANGAWFAGLTLTTVNPTYTPGEVAKQLVDCETKCIVTIPLFVPLIKQVLQSSPEISSAKIIVIGEPQEGCHSFMEMLKTDSSRVKLVTSKDSELDTENDVAALLYSSGTTGHPKGCMLTHHNLVNNCEQFMPAIDINPFTGGNEQEVSMGLLPFFHIMGFQAFNFLSPRVGCHVVCVPKFDPELFIKLLKEHKFTGMHLVTPLISFVLAHPAITAKDFSKVRTIFSGACPSGESIINRLLDKIGHNISFQEGYGMTELSPITHANLPDAKNTKIGSVGPPVPNTLAKIVDTESGKTLGPNEKGEICIKGLQIMKGYLKNEKATKETIDFDGWLHTGDIGFYKEDKHFYVVDRLKELIKVKGMQVAPSELEALLREHENIVDAAVIGIPHPDWGESPRAYIVRKDENLSESEVAEFVKERLSKHKHLAGGIEFIDAVPKAPSGKILRKVLKEGYLARDNKA